MADKKKKETIIKPFENEKDLRNAFDLYASTPKERRGIMKRFISTPSALLDKVFYRVPCNWYEVIRDTPDRIKARNAAHTAPNKISFVYKG